MVERPRDPRRAMWIYVALALAASLSMAQVAADPAQQMPSLPELLEKAIFTEESLGDLRAAIDLYREIVIRAEAERSYAAQAQLRLGLCYQKMGQEDEAVAALRELVEDFPGQAELVAEARARLSDLGIEPDRPGVSLRQVWADALELNGRPSPDGRYITFTDWSTGDLALRDLETGENRRLTRKGSWTTNHYAESSIFSPDGKQIAFSWYAGEPAYELRVIGVDGSGSRVLYAEANTWLQPLDWSSDGRHILSWIVEPGGSEQLALVSVEDGAARIVAMPRYHELSPKKIALSPDGDHLVFSRRESEASKKHDIYLQSMNDGTEVVLVQNAADDLVLGWSPNGSGLLFASDRTGEWGAWFVKVAARKAAGPPELVKSGLGDLVGQISPMGFTHGGSYYYGLTTTMTDVYVATLDGASAPEMATQRFVGANSQPDWSADGKRLAWLTQREGRSTLVLRDLATGEDKEVTISPKLARIGAFQGLRWSPDGRRLLAAGAVTDAVPDENGWWGIIMIDAETGAVTRIGHKAHRHALWAPDGKSMYFERRYPDGTGEIVAVELATGGERTVRAGHVGNMALSPDGRWLAFTTDHFAGDQRHALSLVSTTGGEPREIFHSEAPFFSRTPLAWMPDGGSLIFGTGSTELDAPFTTNDTPFELWKILVEGGEPKRLSISMPHLAHLRVHPDGQRIAFDAGRRTAEIWALENFLPEIVASR